MKLSDKIKYHQNEALIRLMLVQSIDVSARLNMIRPDNRQIDKLIAEARSENDRATLLASNIRLRNVEGKKVNFKKFLRNRKAIAIGNAITLDSLSIKMGVDVRELQRAFSSQRYPVMTYDVIPFEIVEKVLSSCYSHVFVKKH